jgi:uncharacterized protein
MNSLMLSPSHTTRSTSIWQFFGWSFTLSWLIWVPLTLAHFNMGPVRVSEQFSGLVRLLGVLMPAVVAMTLTVRRGGRTELRKLMARLAIWRVHWGWWLAAVGVYPALLVCAAVLFNGLGWQPALRLHPIPPSDLLVSMLILGIATLGEEIGWRGVALPALQRQYSPLKASLILGTAWATWHLPFWLLLGNLEEFGPGYLGLNYLFIVPSTVYLTWIFNRTRSSLLLPVAFHLSFNIVNVAVFPVTSTIGAYALFIGLQGAVVFGIILRMHRPEVLPETA